MTIRTSLLRRDETHRLIPYRPGQDSALNRLADEDRELQDLFELDSATNERLLGEANQLPGIGVHELLFGVAYASIVNAAFTHAHPAGSRFNGPERGAWYAAFELETAESEIAFHKSVELKEIRWAKPETFIFHDYLADFRGEFPDIRGDERYSDCLDPASYVKSQALARDLLSNGAAGIVYPSVRHSTGTCLACFRPALVTNVTRRARPVTLTFQDSSQAPAIAH